MDVKVDVGEVSLDGILDVPADALAVVVFAHGSGSGRLSPRNLQVATALQQHGLGTLLFDLLTAEEEHVDRRTRRLRFDVPLLARRLTGAVDWLGRQPALDGRPTGLFGASTGAAAALVTAAYRPERIAAIVSRGGRPDLAREVLDQVRAPTLLVVGERDTEVLKLNQQAAALMSAPHEIAVVPRATHLFEEPGALEEVARLAADWFRRHLGRPAGDAGQDGG